MKRRRRTCRFCGHAREPHTHAHHQIYCSAVIGVQSTGQAAYCPCEEFDDRPAWLARLDLAGAAALDWLLGRVAAGAHWMLAHEDYVQDRAARRQVRR